MRQTERNNINTKRKLLQSLLSDGWKERAF